MTRTRWALVAALAIAGCLNAAPALAAPGYAAMTSNTTEDILAIEYQADDRAWFTTANGKIFRLVGGNWQQEHSQVGISLFDIEFQRTGNIGLAVGAGGVVLRSSDGGDTWAQVTMPVSNDNGCGADEALGSINKIAFGNETTVYVYGDTNQVMKSTNAGQDFVNFNDAGASCKVSYGSPVTGAFFVPGAAQVTGYVMTQSFGQVFFTANDFGDAQSKGSGPNGFTTPHKLAGDPSNPNRQWGIAANDGDGNGSYFSLTVDGWSNNQSWTTGNPDRRQRDDPQDVAFAGGTVLMVGGSGQIMNSIDGENFFFVDDPAHATQKWLAVGQASATSAIIGGAGGVLIKTTNLNEIPDVAKPTVTIGGPDTVEAGKPATFTAAGVDEPGGSGINAASYAWTATGLSPASGPSATFTFPAAGSATIRVNVRDNAGNVSDTVSKFVTIITPKPILFTQALPPASKPPVTGGAIKKSKGKYVLRVKGTFRLPPGLTQAQACNGTIILTVKKGKRLITARTTKLNSKCQYRKTIRIARSKIGRAKTLTLTVRFGGNAVLAATARNYKVKIKR